MARSPGPRHEASTPLSDIPSLLFFLEKGLDYIKQGYEAEACAVFTLAREHLASNQEPLTSVLDTFIQGYLLYRQAQQELQKASQHFSDAYAEQQARTALLGSLLPKLIQEIDIHPAHLPSPLPPSALKRTGDDAPVPSPYVGTQEPSTPTTPDSSCLVDEALPALYITSFGRFSIKRLGHCVALCPNRTGQAILRYLLTQPGYRASLDQLIVALLPDHDLDASIHKLRVAVSALRRSLNGNHTSCYGGGYILCKAESYYLNPAVRIYIDTDEFLALYQTGCTAGGNAAVPLYKAACRLYTGPFLIEDLYADWSLLKREQFSHIYLEMCDVLTEHSFSMGRYEVAIEWATRALQENRCNEKAHRQLIQAYALQGRRSEALLHYQTCVRMLTEELGVPPGPETVNLFQTISSGRKEGL